MTCDMTLLSSAPSFRLRLSFQISEFRVHCCAITSIHWRCTTALIAKLVIFRYFISTHKAKHVKIIKLNAQVNNKWQKSGESTVAYAIMAPFKIFDSAHAQPEFFRAITVIADVCRVEFCLILSFVSNMKLILFPRLEMHLLCILKCVFTN